MANKNSINIKVRDTETILFEGEIDRISSFNEVGAFDIYPMHANFISIINSKLILYNKNKKLKELTFEQAIMKVKKDIAHIYLGVEMFYIDELTTVTNDKKPGKK